MRKVVYCGLEDERFAGLKPKDRRELFRSLLYQRDRGICQICGQPVSLQNMHADHIIPKSRGGLFRWTNLQLTHQNCNMSKSDFGLRFHKRDDEEDRLDGFKLDYDIAITLISSARHVRLHISGHRISFLRVEVLSDDLLKWLRQADTIGIGCHKARSDNFGLYIVGGQMTFWIETSKSADFNSAYRLQLERSAEAELSSSTTQP